MLLLLIAGALVAHFVLSRSQIFLQEKKVNTRFMDITHYGDSGIMFGPDTEDLREAIGLKIGGYNNEAFDNNREHSLFNPLADYHVIKPKSTQSTWRSPSVGL